MDTFTGNIKAIEMTLAGYRQKNRDHETLINELHELLKTDDIDGIRDLVNAEHGAIHGPRD